MAKDDEIFDLGNLDKGIEKISTLINRLNQADAELVNLSKNALLVSKSLSSIVSPGGLNSSQADNAKLLSDLEKLKAKYEALSNTIVKKAEQNRLAEIRLQQARERAFDTFERNAQREQAALAKSEGAYQRIQNSVNLLTQTYNNLAIRKQLGNTLSAKEEKQLESLSKRINTYQTALKQVDAQIQKNGRNVGNYTNQYNGLGNAVNQITREAPSGAVSINTFFLAISNNLPILFDELGRIRKENALLAAEGKQGVPVYKQLANAFLSWGTALSLGVTLLTLFGGKIVQAITGMGSMEERLKKITAQQEKYNQQLEDSNRNIEHNIVLEKNRRKLLGQSEKDFIELDKEAALQKLKNFETTRDANKKLLDDRIKQVIKEKDLSFTNYTYEIGLTEKLNKEKLRLEKIWHDAAFKAAYSKDKNIRTSSENLAVQTQKDLSKINKLIIADEALTQDQVFKKREQGYIKSNSEAILYGQKVSELFSDLAVKEKENNDEQLANLAEMNKKEIELLIAKNNVLLDDEDAYYSDRFKALNNNFSLRKRLAELDRDESIRLAKDSYEKQQTALLEFQIKKLEITQSYIKKRAELEKLDLDPIRELLNTDFRKDLMKPVEDSAKRAGKELEEAGKKADKLHEALLKLQASTNAWLKSFSSDVFKNSGFASLETFFDGTFKNLLAGAEGTKEKFAVYFNSISESAQEAFNFISQASQNNFDAEKTRLENQYDVALKYAGESKEAQEKLAADLEKKKKDIAYREAKAKQKQAIFNIAVDTAQAIIGLWANPGFPAAIPLALVVGALGAAQIAMVSSQEIPQYWMGGTHDGGLMMVNDGKGSNYRETIVTPDGKIMQPTGRNVIMDAPAGTEIFTHDQWQNTLSDMLKGKGIDMYVPQQNYSGISKSDMKDVLMETIGSQSQNFINFDENGITQSFINKGNKTTAYTKRGNSTKLRFG